MGEVMFVQFFFGRVAWVAFWFKWIYFLGRSFFHWRKLLDWSRRKWIIWAEEIRHLIFFSLILAQELAQGVCSADITLPIFLMRQSCCTCKRHER